MKRYLSGKLSGRSGNSLLDTAERIADAQNNVVLVFCNANYRQVLANWLAIAARHGDLPVMVIALDRKLETALRRQGIPVVLRRARKDLSDIWRVRIEAISDLVAAGYNVVHSDADAVWTKNPMPMLSLLDCDIVSSPGTIWPATSLSAWGHVLCFGFIMFRSSAGSKLLLGRISKLAKAKGFDDQRELNELLLNAEIEWDRSDGYFLEMNGKSFRCYTDTIFGEVTLDTDTRLRVALLPHRQFQRLPNGVEDVADRMVVHPISTKTSDNTQVILERENCWIMGAGR